MPRDSLLDFIEIKAMEAALTLSEYDLHGLVVGTIVAQGEIDVSQVVKAIEARRPEMCEHDPLAEMIAAAAQQLDDKDLGFRVLLPVNETLELQAEALLQYLEAFIEALDKIEFSKEDDEAGEIVASFKQLLEMDTEADFDQADEASFAEIIEYVQTATMLLREHLK